MSPDIVAPPTTNAQKIADADALAVWFETLCDETPIAIELDTDELLVGAPCMNWQAADELTPRPYSADGFHSPMGTRQLVELGFAGIAETAAANAEKVDPLLLYALSREESTFDPQIVSWAGATGLTQLMPATAVGAYATVYRKRLTDLSVLTDPALNLRLGAHVLGDGLRRFGVVPLALAAYNGGPGLASRTLPRSKAIDFDLWVETISVRETRRYVKRVIGTWGKYRFLYDGESPFIDLPDAIEPRS